MSPLNAQNEAMKKGNKRLWLVPLILVFVITIFFSIPCFPQLVITMGRNAEGGTVLMKPLKENEEFYITYTHSVNLSPIRDTFVYENEMMHTTETLFQTFGAGVPIPEDGIGSTFTKTDEGYLLTGIDSWSESFYIMMQEIPDHRLTHRGETIYLNEISGVGELIEVSVRSASLFEIAFHALTLGV